MNTTDILKEFEAAGAILRGHFILSSGLHSDTYLQCARVLMEAPRAEKLCAALAQNIRATLPDAVFDCVVAPAMGGVVVGYEMGRQMGIPSMFCERVEGKFQLRRGFELPKGARVLLVEDVVTTGKSSLETVECIAAHGGIVTAEASLVNRSGEDHPLPFPLISLLKLAVATYAADALPPALAALPAVKPGSRGLKSA